MVREDLPPGSQVAQAVHAAVEHALDYPTEVHGAPVVVVLGVPDELGLNLLADELQGCGLELNRFTEPDLPRSKLFGDRSEQLTAIALVAGRDVPELSRLDLLLREEVRR